MRESFEEQNKVFNDIWEHAYKGIIVSPIVINLSHLSVIVNNAKKLNNLYPKPSWDKHE